MVAKFIETYAEKDIDFDYAYKLAYLHDSIEDTEITYDYLLDNFGKDVADGVFALTKNKEVPYENQIADSVSRIVNLGKREVAITKMADRCCNLLEVLNTWSNEKYEKYKIRDKETFKIKGYDNAYVDHDFIITLSKQEYNTIKTDIIINEKKQGNLIGKVNTYMGKELIDTNNIYLKKETKKLNLLDKIIQFFENILPF